MVLEHEIPQGSKLYFGNSAKIKRNIQNSAVELFEKEGFEEIVSPYFSYKIHQDGSDERSLIRLANEKNHAITLRSDSTLDVVRIITKRLGRTTLHKKWFYIQPVFSYPNCEMYQIGLEWIDNANLRDVLKICTELFSILKISPKLQLCNIKIPLLLSQELDIQKEHFFTQNVETLLKYKEIKELLHLESKEELAGAIKNAPSFIKDELENLLALGSGIEYKNMIFSPLYYADFAYYDGIFFRAFEANSTIAMGGRYENDGVVSSGFAVYTDEVIEILLKGKN